MTERDRAAVDVDLSGSRPSSRTTRGSGSRTPRSARSGRGRRARRAPRARRVAGIGPRPITRGSTPATAVLTNAPAVQPERRAPASTSTTAAAPSLIPELLPAVTVPSRRKAGLSAASLSTVVSGRGCSSRHERHRSGMGSGPVPAVREVTRVGWRPRSAAGSGARTRPGRRGSRHTARRHSRLSRPSTRAGYCSAMRGLTKRQPRVVSCQDRGPRS